MNSPNTFSVLVVDDDFMVARIHTRYLATVPGFSVVGTVHTGADALAALAEHQPDLMLLDVYLPDMTGIEVLRRARSEFPDVDVIVVTAARELDTVREAMQGGAISYLVKPFEYEALGERLEHYRRTRSVLDTARTADQQQIDALFGLQTGTGSGAGQPAQGPEPGDGARRPSDPEEGRAGVGHRVRRRRSASPGSAPGATWSIWRAPGWSTSACGTASADRNGCYRLR